MWKQNWNWNETENYLCTYTKQNLTETWLKPDWNLTETWLKPDWNLTETKPKHKHIILIDHCFVSISVFSWKLKQKQKRNRMLLVPLLFIIKMTFICYQNSFTLWPFKLLKLEKWHDELHIFFSFESCKVNTNTCLSAYDLNRLYIYYLRSSYYVIDSRMSSSHLHNNLW